MSLTTCKNIHLFVLILQIITWKSHFIFASTTNPSSATSSSSTIIEHRINPNITILHEVHEEGFSTKKDKPPNPDIQPLKHMKKKPYLPLDKPYSSHEKPKPLKELELHPVVFDFNLGDLEDLEHENFKKKDLSAEEKLLLRDGAVIGNLQTGSTIAYSEDVKIPDAETLQDDLTVQVDIVTSTEKSNKKLATNFYSTSKGEEYAVTPTSTFSSPSTAASTSSTTTVSPHILKIFKPKSAKKGRELMKQDELLHKGLNNHNSLNHYLTISDNGGNNQTAESLQQANIFQIITNIYDHFYWQPSEIRNKVTTACGLEMQAYLTALHGNYRWAQAAYDSSARYRGQLLFGNDKWLGQRQFCYELNRQLDPEKRKHFEFEFYVALIVFQLELPDKFSARLQVGECLPKSCTAQDVQHLLEIDPHASMLTSMNSSHTPAVVKILGVRTVPGLYSYWRELRFQIFASLMLTLFLLIISATWYQSHLGEQRLQQQTHIAVISGSKVDSPTIHHISSADNGKSFELYQMSSLNDNNNASTETNEHNDTNGKKLSYFNGQHELDINSNRQGASGLGHSNNNNNNSSNSNGSHSAHDMEYRIETTSNAGAPETYEAKQQLGIHEQVLLCFAFQTNASTILSLDPSKESQTSCVHGLRVISVMWTIMVHTYLQVFNIGENRFTRVIVERTTWYQFIGNATFSVDTFFFISGFLVTLLYLKQDKKLPERTSQFLKKGFLDTTIVVIYRYIRLTPTYLFVIFFNDFARRQTFDNSVFQPSVPYQTCGQYWWRNILYINNFYPLKEICMIWSWYMANDMQFFVMASFLLMFSMRYSKAVVLTLVTFLLSSWGISGVISLHYHYTHKVSSPFESFDFLYDKPWQRVGPYIIGMLTGYIMSRVRTPPKVSGRLNTLLWFLSLGLLVLIICGVWHGELNEVPTAFYVSMAHTGFGVALIWIVLSCCWNLSPTMNRILSYRCLWPLSRLTYCAYLIHPVIMLVLSYRMDGTIHLNPLFITVIFFGNAVVSFIAAFFISVAFESPVIRLLKILFHK
uniref:Nose resistant-to-fluoxetine protein N-terminal domain-containing protein n=1 Tax=Stomoxys calcitrans TaxID=35570 RepID=A0A1I8Q753_STOCA